MGMQVDLFNKVFRCFSVNTKRLPAGSQPGPQKQDGRTEKWRQKNLLFYIFAAIFLPSSFAGPAAPGELDAEALQSAYRQILDAFAPGGKWGAIDFPRSLSHFPAFEGGCFGVTKNDPLTWEKRLL
jgi:hypothetical protein